MSSGACHCSALGAVLSVVRPPCFDGPTFAQRDAALLLLPVSPHPADVMRHGGADAGDHGQRRPLMECLGDARTVQNRVLREATTPWSRCSAKAAAFYRDYSRRGVPADARVHGPSARTAAAWRDLDRAADYLEREFNPFSILAMSMSSRLIVGLVAWVAVIVLASGCRSCIQLPRGRLPEPPPMPRHNFTPTRRLRQVRAQDHARLPLVDSCRDRDSACFTCDISDAHQDAPCGKARATSLSAGWEPTGSQSRIRAPKTASTPCCSRLRASPGRSATARAVTSGACRPTPGATATSTASQAAVAVSTCSRSVPMAPRAAKATPPTSATGAEQRCPAPVASPWWS